VDAYVEVELDGENREHPEGIGDASPPEQLAISRENELGNVARSRFGALGRDLLAVREQKCRVVAASTAHLLRRELETSQRMWNREPLHLDSASATWLLDQEAAVGSAACHGSFVPTNHAVNASRRTSRVPTRAGEGLAVKLRQRLPERRRHGVRRPGFRQGNVQA